MKTVFSSYQELCHMWASGSQSVGRACNARMSFDGDDLYSYGTVIATRIRHKGNVAYLADSATFSNSTSNHQGFARSAIPRSAKRFYVNIGSWGQSLKFTAHSLRDHYLAEFRKEGEKSRYKHIRARTFIHRYDQLMKALDVCEFFGIGSLRVRDLLEEHENEYACHKVILEEYEKKRRERNEYRRSEFYTLFGR